MNSLGIVLCFALICAAANINRAQEVSAANNETVKTNKLFTYSGPLLPQDWSLVSILNDRAVIAFNNGSARNSPITELDSKDKSFLERLQNGTIYATPLSSAKEKLSQWSSTVSSTVSKFSKSVKDQLDSLINNKPKETNSTIVFS